jgi:integrase
MPKLLFSKTIIDAAKCPAGMAKYNLFDSGCKGLMLEVRPTGLQIYCLRYIDLRGKQRQIKLADARDVTLAQARQLADQFRSQIAMGEDPLAKRTELKKVPKLETFVFESYIPFVQGYKRSWKCDLGLLNNHVLPVFGSKYLDEISKQDIIKFIAVHRTTHAPGSVNRIIILLRYMFNLAIRWEIAGLTKNPTSSIPLLEELNKKERFLSKDETERLYGVLKSSDNTLLQYIVPMLILTGARKMEVLKARWEDFDIQKRQWRIPITKAGRPRYVPLSSGVINLLANVPHKEGNPWVFPNPKTGKPYISIFNSWNAARIAAGLADVRCHDLRHSFASFLVNAGRSLYEVQIILGHTQIKTTQRYAHLSQDTLLEAVNAASEIAGSMIYAVEPVKPDQLGYRNV